MQAHNFLSILKPKWLWEVKDFCKSAATSFGSKTWLNWHELFIVFIYLSVNSHTFSSRNINVIKNAYLLLGVLHNTLQIYLDDFLKPEKPASQNIFGPSVFG